MRLSVAASFAARRCARQSADPGLGAEALRPRRLDKGQRPGAPAPPYGGLGQERLINRTRRRGGPPEVPADSWPTTQSLALPKVLNLSRRRSFGLGGSTPPDNAELYPRDVQERHTRIRLGAPCRRGAMHRRIRARGNHFAANRALKPRRWANPLIGMVRRDGSSAAPLPDLFDGWGSELWAGPQPETGRPTRKLG